MMSAATTTPRRMRLLTAGVLAATFALGAITGVGISRWLLAARHDAAEDLPRGPWPLRELDLSDEQRSQIRDIFERHRPKLDSVLRESFPLVRTVHEAIDREIRDVLNQRNDGAGGNSAGAAGNSAQYPFEPHRTVTRTARLR